MWQGGRVLLYVHAYHLHVCNVPGYRQNQSLKWLLQYSQSHVQKFWTLSLSTFLKNTHRVLIECIVLCTGYSMVRWSFPRDGRGRLFVWMDPIICNGIWSLVSCMHRIKRIAHKLKIIAIIKASSRKHTSHHHDRRQSYHSTWPDCYRQSKCWHHFSPCQANEDISWNCSFCPTSSW